MYTKYTVFFYQVIATVRSPAKFPDELRTAGARQLILNLDNSDEHIQQAAEQAFTFFGHVDILVNNAGTNVNGYGPIEELRCACCCIGLCSY